MEETPLMPPRSKVVSLPAEMRAEVERRMAEKGFGDYPGLAAWVRQQGYEISDDSLWRYGRAIQQQMTAVQIAEHQARALVESASDRATVLEAVMAMAGQKM